MHAFASKIAAILGFAVVASLPAVAFAGMPTGDRTSQPIGHFDYCKAYSEDCQANDRIGVVRLTDATWQTILEINDAVNTAISPRTDEDMHGVPELWSYPTTEGDCEDYALLKRYMLEREGMPKSALLMTVVRQSNGEGHAVLTIRTDRGDFILDNLETRVLAWQDTTYRYLKRQSAEHAGMWTGIEDDRAVLVGSVR